MPFAWRSLLLSFFLMFSPFVFAQENATPPNPSNLAQDKLDKARQIVDAGSANVEMKSAPAEEDFSLAHSASKMMQQLGLLVGILLVGVWALKKWVIKETPIANRQIKIIDRIAVDQRTRLTLVEVAGEKILVGHSSSDVSLLNIGTVKKEGKDFDISLSEAIKE